MSQVSLVPVLLWVAAILFWGVAVLRGPRPILQAFVVDRLLRYLFIFPLGLLGLWAFAGHVFFPEQAAAAIADIYGDVRARLIAVTESTAAYSRGVEALGASLAGQGVFTNEYWLTVNDNLVCQFCQALHGTLRGVDWTDPPPDGSHPGCRCGPVLVPVGDVIDDPFFEFVGDV